MRWLLLTAFVVSAGVATYAGLERGPKIRIEVEAGYALPELADAYNPIARRGWFGQVAITARSERPCRSLTVTARQYPSGLYGQEAVFVRLRGVGSRVRGSGTYAIYAGEPYRIEVSAECHGGPGNGRRGTASTTVRAGYRPCRGPARVLRSSSPALAVGTVLEQGERIDADRPVVVGAPECNGFHATLPSGSTGIGSYASGGRGAAFAGRAITISRGDPNGGAFAVEGTPLVVRPRSAPCVDCAHPFPSAYAVRSRAGRVVIRVYRGAVDVVGADTMRRLVEVHDAFFSCTSARSCRLVDVRLVQPGEPLTIERRPLARLRSVLPGATAPPREALAPPRAEARVSAVEAAGGEPRQLVAAWSRKTRRTGEGDAREETGLFIWRQARGAWRLVHRYHATQFEPSLGSRFADVTGDGHRDVLVDRLTGGSGGCGTRVVFASLQGRIRRVYQRSFCEGSIEAGSGGLVQRLPVGPCPHRQGGAHCFGGVATTVLRLKGERLVPVRRTVTCQLPRLDPSRDCA